MVYTHVLNHGPLGVRRPVERLYVFADTVRGASNGEKIRIISARRASRKERAADSSGSAG